jgi:hypothetical protein
MPPTLVVPAYNRPQALARLLAALRGAKYPRGDNVRLHISIDAGGNRAVQELAEQFNWENGEKRVVCQPEHLGLVRHFHLCGDLTRDYGAIILLEDDLVVSPVFYTFAAGALAFYEADQQVAGISLYSLWFNGYTHQAFIPLPDDSDVFFLQVPYHQGQAFSHSQWSRYAGWLAAADRRLSPQDPIHPLFLAFDDQDWFPLRMKFLIDTDQTYVFPRESLASSSGDPGTHFPHGTSFLQVPLQRFKEVYRFKPLADSPAVYDSYFEILPSRLDRLTPALQGYDYEVDLYGEKPPDHLRREFILTSKRCRDPLLGFGKQAWPHEANVIDELQGQEICLCRKEDLRLGWLDRLAMQKSNADYFNRRRPFAKRQFLRFMLLNILERLGIYRKLEGE